MEGCGRAFVSLRTGERKRLKIVYKIIENMKQEAVLNNEDENSSFLLLLSNFSDRNNENTLVSLLTFIIFPVDRIFLILFIRLVLFFRLGRRGKPSASAVCPADTPTSF